MIQDESFWNYTSFTLHPTFAGFHPTCVWGLVRWVFKLRIGRARTHAHTNKHLLISFIFRRWLPLLLSCMLPKWPKQSSFKILTELFYWKWASLIKKTNKQTSLSFNCIIKFSKTSDAFIFLPDFSSSFAVCWEPYNRTGRHQKTQV